MKKKKLVIILIILVFILMLVIGVITMGKKNQNITVTKLISDERVEDLIYGSYLYYVFSKGPLPLGDAYLINEDKKYFAVDLELSSLEEISNRITDIIGENRSEIMINDVFGNENREYINLGGIIYAYVSEDDEECIIKDFSIDSEWEVIKISKEKIKINYNNDQFEVNVILDNGKWVLEDIFFICNNGIVTSEE